MSFHKVEFSHFYNLVIHFTGPGAATSKKSAGDGFELESQFVLRVPPAAAADLREAVRQGNSNLKERLAISLESTNRTGLVR